MRLIFIRHAEPDYKNNTLTKKGFREAAILAERTASWENVREAYVSPLARAQLTAAPCLEKLRLSAFTYDWLQEFLYPVWNPETGERSIAWDLSPAYFSKEPGFYSPTGWLDTPLIRSNPDIGPAYREICEGLDGILKSHGYVREGMMYRALPETAGDEDESIVFFCHFGITCFMMAHLTGISPILLLHHTIIPPSGVTVMNAEKDDDGAAHFRAQGIGDVSHLQRAGEPISKSGAFTPLFQE